MDQIDEISKDIKDVLPKDPIVKKSHKHHYLVTIAVILSITIASAFIWWNAQSNEIDGINETIDYGNETFVPIIVEQKVVDTVYLIDL